MQRFRGGLVFKAHRLNSAKMLPPSSRAASSDSKRCPPRAFRVSPGRLFRGTRCFQRAISAPGRCGVGLEGVKRARCRHPAMQGGRGAGVKGGREAVVCTCISRPAWRDRSELNNSKSSCEVLSGWLCWLVGTAYRGTSLIRNTPLLGPYSRTMHLGSYGGPRGGAVSYERGTHVKGLLANKDTHPPRVLQYGYA